MALTIQVRADLAPMPALRRAIELLEQSSLTVEGYEALGVLRHAYRQADFAANRRDNGPTERELIRGILGADVE